jgi:hypothetical protein
VRTPAESDRTLRDGSFEAHMSQALRAKLQFARSLLDNKLRERIKEDEQTNVSFRSLRCRDEGLVHPEELSCLANGSETVIVPELDLVRRISLRIMKLVRR